MPEYSVVIGYLLTGWLIAVIIIALLLAFLSRKTVSTPLFFPRTKIYQARVCLSCDTIFNHNEQLCPLCFEREFIPVAKYIPPMILAREATEAKQHGTYLSLSMVSKEVRNGGPNPNFDPDKYARFSGPKFGFPQTAEQSGSTQDNSNEPSPTGVSKSDNPSGVGMEVESNFEQGSARSDANTSIIRKIICWCRQRGIVLSRQKHRDWMHHSKTLPEKYKEFTTSS